MNRHPEALVTLANRLKISARELAAFAEAQGLSPEEYVRQVEDGQARMGCNVPEEFDLLAWLD